MKVFKTIPREQTKSKKLRSGHVPHVQLTEGKTLSTVFCSMISFRRVGGVLTVL